MRKNNLEKLMNYFGMDTIKLATVSGVPEDRIRLLLEEPCTGGEVTEELSIYEKVRLAHALRTSVSMLMGTNFFPLQVAVSRDAVPDHAGSPGYWGNVSVTGQTRVINRFYPITEEERNICVLYSSKFMFIATMENSLVLVNKDIAKVEYSQLDGTVWCPLANFDIRDLYLEDKSDGHFAKVMSNLPLELSEDAGLEIDKKTGTVVNPDAILSVWTVNSLVTVVFADENDFSLEDFNKEEFVKLAGYVFGWEDMEGKPCYMGHVLEKVAFIEFPLLLADKAISEYLESKK